MTKITLIATAVALAVSGSAMAAGHGGGNTVKISGEVDMMYTTNNGPASVATVKHDDVTLNIAATTDLGTGTTGFANYRLDGGVSQTGVTSDSVKVGLKGSWGTFTMGEVAMGSAFAELAGDINGDPSPEVQGMTYSKKMGDISFTGGISPDGNSDLTTFGAKWSNGQYTIGGGLNNESNGAAASTKTSLVGASAKFGAITLGFMTGDIKDVKATAFKVGYSAGKVSASFTSATLNDDEANTRIDAAYKLGGTASVSFRSHKDGDADLTTNRVMLTVKF